VQEKSEELHVDELRQRLRSMGYLDAGVNRFVLGPATDRRRPSAIALLAALRVGALAALLLGPAAAFGLNGRVPGLVTGPRDAIVLAIYLGVFFGAAVALATFAISVAAATLASDRVAERARGLSRAANAVITIACLAYLTLWWRSANAGFGWTAPVWTAFALAIAVGISLLLGQVTSSAAFAVAIARHGDAPSFQRPQSSSTQSWVPTVLAALVAFAGAAALLVVTAPREPVTTTSPPLAVVSGGLRVKVIGIDGIDPHVVYDLAAAGRLPALSPSLHGARAQLALVEANSARDPARIWTTIATGQPAAVHGVTELETRRLAGVQGTMASGNESPVARSIRGATDLLRLTRPSIASGHERKAKTIWEIAADAGLRTAVVNWWATWPATAGGDGTVVLSDRAVLRLDRGGALDAEIAPTSLYDRLKARWPAIRKKALAGARDAAASLEWGDGDTRAVLTRSAELDAMQIELLREVSVPAPDLSAVYLPGLDIAQNALLGGRDTALAPSAVSIRLQALRDYTVFLDRLLSDVVAPKESEVVVVLMQPGRVAASAAGLLSVSGSAAAARADVQARIVDAAPTILHTLGIPISRELPGAPLLALFSPDFVRRYPIRQAATYGAPSIKTGDRSGQPLDEEMIDRLRSLGYVK
jgi:type I phosphodiesterase/nucleotide pyrophosphatase